MAQASQDAFHREAFDDPYGFVDRDLLARYLDTVEILPIDAAKDDNIPTDMTWAESHLGVDGPLCVTDYGRHRGDCDTLADFVELVREKLQDGTMSQYLKFMNDDKSEVADTLVAVSKANGYVVIPYFGEVPE